MKRIRTRLGGAALALGMAAAHTAAGATVLQATGSGACASTYHTCNNTDTSTIANTFTGYYARTSSRSWFAFDLSALAGRPITSATLSIWSDGDNRPDLSTDVYALYHAEAIGYEGLKTGSVLGSVTAGIADTGASHYVDIALNATDLAALHAGGLFVFGGDTTGASEFFGGTDGVPVARLDVDTGPGANVPEPATPALLGLGLLGIVLGRRAYAAAPARARSR